MLYVVSSNNLIYYKLLMIRFENNVGFVSLTLNDLKIRPQNWCFTGYNNSDLKTVGCDI